MEPTSANDASSEPATEPERDAKPEADSAETPEAAPAVQPIVVGESSAAAATNSALDVDDDDDDVRGND